MGGAIISDLNSLVELIVYQEFSEYWWRVKSNSSIANTVFT